MAIEDTLDEEAADPKPDDEDDVADDLVALDEDNDEDVYGFDDDDSLRESRMAFLRSFSSFLCIVLRFMMPGGQK